MASVFLSYAREDAAKAKLLAKALEQAGHDVWWDGHIRSGSEFAGAIEEALNRADAVLVLWSEASVRSPWVRDEAAEGRDSGRLVPAVLDGSRPPIGFRQFHATELSGWTGRGTPKQMGELLSAIDEKGAAGDRTDKPREPAHAKPATVEGRRFGLRAALGVLAAAVVLVGAWLYWQRDSAFVAEKPTLAVLPFADLSPQRDKAYFSEGVAEEILSVLARDPGIRVIGRSSARQFQEASSDLQGIRKALGVTHVLEGSARTSGDELRMTVRLINAADGSQLWAEDYHRKMSNIFAVQAEIGRAVAERLSGTLSRNVGETNRQSTGTDTYTAYLAARAKMRERTLPALNQALKLAEQVLAADPNYAPGHAIYAELLWLLSQENYGTAPFDRLRERATRHALRAIRLAPNQPEGYAALGAVSDGKEAIAALEKAIELDPSRSELRLWLAGAYEDLGRYSDALEAHRAAVAMEPIWGTAVRNLANYLAASEQYEEAEGVVREFERRGGTPAYATLIRAQNAWMGGDLSQAIFHSEVVARTNPELLSNSPAHPMLYHDLGFLERAESLSGSDPRLRLYTAGKYHELAQRVEAEGYWEQPTQWLAIDALALTRSWAAMERFYHQRAARQLCSHFDGPKVAIHFATALKARGRADEAAQLVGCARRRLAVLSNGPVRVARYSAMYLAALSAEVSALEGNRAAAFGEMNRAYDLGLWTPRAFGLGFHPAFDPFRGSREYAELDARFKRRTAAERDQVLKSPWSRQLRPVLR